MEKPRDDLNAWTKNGAQSDDLNAAIANADVLHEPEGNISLGKGEGDNAQDPGKFPLEALNPVMRKIVEESAKLIKLTSRFLRWQVLECLLAPSASALL